MLLNGNKIGPEAAAAIGGGRDWWRAWSEQELGSIGYGGQPVRL